MDMQEHPDTCARGSLQDKKEPGVKNEGGWAKDPGQVFSTLPCSSLNSQGGEGFYFEILEFQVINANIFHMVRRQSIFYLSCSV